MLNACVQYEFLSQYFCRIMCTCRYMCVVQFSEKGIISRGIDSRGAKRQVKVLLRYAANQKVKVMMCELYSCTYAFIEF